MDPTIIVMHLATLLGVSPATLVAIIGVIIAVSNMLGRVIPDDAVGFLGFVRRVAKVIGLYTSNRISSGITVNQIAKASVGVEAKDAVVEAMQEAGSLLPEKAVTLTRDASGKFQKLNSHWLATVLTFLFVIVAFAGLAGCATIGAGAVQVGDRACKNRVTLEAAANLAIQQAQTYESAFARAMMINAANTTLQMLQACPAAK